MRERCGLCGAICAVSLLTGGINVGEARAQVSAAGKPEFEVASLKPAPSGARRRLMPWQFQAGIEGGPGRVTMHNRALVDLVAGAYRVHADMVSGPAWASEQLYDLDAKLPPGANYAEAAGMLKTLLEERFKLILHEEQRAEQGYNLEVAHGGPRLKAWVPDPGDVQRTPQEQVQDMVADLTANGLSGGLAPVATGKSSMANLAGVLSSYLKCPVADATGVSGEYDLDLRVPVRDLFSRAMPNGQDGGEPSDSLVDGLAKLGLRLKATRVQVKALVIDHAQRLPEPN